MFSKEAETNTILYDHPLLIKKPDQKHSVIITITFANILVINQGGTTIAYRWPVA